MATSGYDVMQGAIVAEENTDSMWFKETQNLARSERRCVRVLPRYCDKSQGDNACS